VAWVTAREAGVNLRTLANLAWAAEFPDRHAELLSLVCQVFPDAGAGKTMAPMGRVSSMASLRLNGATFARRLQSGLNAICGRLAMIGRAGCDALGALGAPALQQHHVRVLGVT